MRKEASLSEADLQKEKVGPIRLLQFMCSTPIGGTDKLNPVGCSATWAKSFNDFASLANEISTVALLHSFG
jgi:hypothetical protein